MSNNRVPPLHLTRKEALVLNMLVGVGATAFDMPVGIGNKVREGMEKKFGIEVSGEDIASIINKTKALVEEPGHEDVVVGDD